MVLRRLIRKRRPSRKKYITESILSDYSDLSSSNSFEASLPPPPIMIPYTIETPDRNEIASAPQENSEGILRIGTVSVLQKSKNNEKRLEEAKTLSPSLPLQRTVSNEINENIEQLTPENKIIRDPTPKSVIGKGIAFSTPLYRKKLSLNWVTESPIQKKSNPINRKAPNHDEHLKNGFSRKSKLVDETPSCRRLSKQLFLKNMTSNMVNGMTKLGLIGQKLDEWDSHRESAIIKKTNKSDNSHKNKNNELLKESSVPINVNTKIGHNKFILQEKPDTVKKSSQIDNNNDKNSSLNNVSNKSVAQNETEPRNILQNNLSIQKDLKVTENLMVKGNSRDTTKIKDKKDKSVNEQNVGPGMKVLTVDVVQLNIAELLRNSKSVPVTTIPGKSTENIPNNNVSNESATSQNEANNRSERLTSLIKESGKSIKNKTPLAGLSHTKNITENKSKENKNILRAKLQQTLKKIRIPRSDETEIYFTEISKTRTDKSIAGNGRRKLYSKDAAIDDHEPHDLYQEPHGCNNVTSSNSKKDHTEENVFLIPPPAPPIENMHPQVLNQINAIQTKSNIARKNTKKKRENVSITKIPETANSNNQLLITDQSETSNARRSTRTRVKPVAYWIQGCRVQYANDDQNLRKIVSVPQFVEAEEPPAKKSRKQNDQKRTRKHNDGAKKVKERKTNRKKMKQQPSEQSINTETINDDIIVSDEALQTAKKKTRSKKSKGAANLPEFSKMTDATDLLVIREIAVAPDVHDTREIAASDDPPDSETALALDSQNNNAFKSAAIDSSKVGLPVQTTTGFSSCVVEIENEILHENDIQEINELVGPPTRGIHRTIDLPTGLTECYSRHVDDSDYKMVSPKMFMATALEANNIKVLHIKLKPYGEKRLGYSQKSDFIFFVLKGRISVKIHAAQTESSTGEFFYVPRGIRYQIRNNTKYDALLICTTIETSTNGN